MTSDREGHGEEGPTSPLRRGACAETESGPRLRLDLRQPERRRAGRQRGISRVHCLVRRVRRGWGARGDRRVGL